MPTLNNILEVALGVTNGVNTIFSTTKPYLANSAQLYLNGQLKVPTAPDGFIELTPTSVQLNIPPNATDTVQLAYLTFSPIFVDEAVPIHIKDLPNGAQLKISMKAGAHLNQDFTGLAQTPRKRLAAKGFSRTTFYAYLVSNQPQIGQMHLNLQPNHVNVPTFSAIVEYKNILHIQRIVSRGRPVVETAPISHPGAKALGTKMSQLFPQFYLVPVLFVGS